MPVVFSTLYTALIQHPQCQCYSASSTPHLIQHPQCQWYSAPCTLHLISAPSMPVVFSTLYTAFNSAPSMHDIQYPQCTLFSAVNAWSSIPQCRVKFRTLNAAWMVFNTLNARWYSAPSTQQGIQHSQCRVILSSIRV